MKFKFWLESLAGPGGGPNPQADSPEQMGKEDAKKGVGAFHAFSQNDRPPIARRSPTAGYLDPRFARMRKQMRREYQENIPSVQIVRNILPQLAQAAQQIYNAWTQNDDGYDDMYGGGGICHNIAEAMCGVLNSQGIECTTFSASIGEVHVWVVAKFSEGVYSIDIPPSIYETGGGYTWKKMRDVTFEPSDVSLYRITADPNDFDQYSEDY